MESNLSYFFMKVSENSSVITLFDNHYRELYDAFKLESSFVLLGNSNYPHGYCIVYKVTDDTISSIALTTSNFRAVAIDVLRFGKNIGEIEFNKSIIDSCVRNNIRITGYEPSKDDLSYMLSWLEDKEEYELCQYLLETYF